MGNNGQTWSVIVDSDIRRNRGMGGVGLDGRTELKGKMEGKKDGQKKERWKTERMERDEGRPVSVSYYRWPLSNLNNLSSFPLGLYSLSLSISLFVSLLLIWTLTTSLFLSFLCSPPFTLFLFLVIRSHKAPPQCR